jgi:D-beta-D-heptose 7-phosphate kinase/D-beta-D-heptose 1-phosphate adenosyltransferase
MRITVVGDLILDRYLHCTSDRSNPESGGRVYKVERVEYQLGGAGAVARLAKAMGAEVTLVTAAVGNSGSKLAGLAWHDCDRVRYLFAEGKENSIKQRVICDGRVGHDRIDQDSVLNVSEQPFPVGSLDADCILVADYGKGVCTDALLRKIMGHPKVIVDPARGRNWSAYRGATLIKPNLTEARMLVPNGASDQAAKQLSETFSVDVVMTLGSGGMYYANPEVQWIKAEPAEEVDVTGAGDTVLAALGVTWGEMSPVECCQFAARMAAQQVGQLGIAPCRNEPS